MPTYQSVDRVRHILRDIGLDVAKYEEDGSLLIIDSVKGNFGSGADILGLVKILSRRAQNQSRSGCFVIGDMGAFYFIGRINDLMKHESSIPLKVGYDDNLINCKAFCIYHQKDFERLAEDQKQLLLQHHYRSFIARELDPYASYRLT